MSTIKVSNIQDIANNAAMSMSNGVVTFTKVPVNAGGGKLLQMKKFLRNSVGYFSNTIPYDDSVPQIGEGSLIFTLAFTPTKATSELKLEISAMVANQDVTQITIALFQDSISNALAASGSFNSASNQPHNISFSHIMNAGSTSTKTFTVRMGAGGGNSILNGGASGGRRYGGVASSGIVITEIGA